MPTVGTKAQVYHGAADRTSGGLKKKDLMKNKRGRIVSKKQHAAGKRAYTRNKLAKYKKTKAQMAQLRAKRR